MILKDKDRYQSFCRSYEDLPLYFQHWYLDSVCGEENWDVLLCIEKDQVLGVFPYFTSRIPVLGSKIKMPLITPFMGVFLVIAPTLKNEKRIGLEKKISTELIESLPEFKYFNVRCHHSLTNWLPFYWKGFSQRTMYTYIIRDISDLDQVYSNFKSTVRNKIRKAEQEVTVEIKNDIDSFYELNKMSFERQKMEIGYNLQFIRKIDEAFANNNARTIFFAKDKLNRIHSALYLTYDKNTAYVHLAGENPALRNSGAGALLMWEAIKYSRNQKNLKSFDFEGSIIETIEENRRSFGAEQVAYHKIQKVNSPLLKLVFFFSDLVGKRLN